MKIHRPKITRPSIKRFAKSGFFVAIFSGSLPLLDYTHQDVIISDPSEVILLTIFFAIIGLVFLASYGLWLKTNGERLFATIITTSCLAQYRIDVLANFDWLQSSLGHAKSVVIIELGIYIAAGIASKMLRQAEKYAESKAWTKKPLGTIVKFVCVLTLVINVYHFGSYIDANAKVGTYQPPSKVSVSKLQPGAGPSPDIYYFVFDRYGNSQSLKNYFDFDNSAFLDQLRDRGFAVRDPAFSNYQFTAPSVASTLRMDYHDDIAKDLPGVQPSSFLPYKKIFEDSQVAALFREAGYDVYNLGNWWNVTRKMTSATNVLPQFQATIFGKSFILSELQSNAVARTFLGGLLKYDLGAFGKTFLRVTSYTPRQLYQSQLSETARLASQPGNKPRFVFAHFLNAHPPYVFNPDGSQPAYNGGENNNDASRKVKYVNQLKYANDTALELIDTIQKQSKNPPIIIIQADEGPYPLELPSDWKEAPADVLKLKLGILAAYSLPDVSGEEAAKIGSSVNTFRFVFNKYFGAKLDYLPDCSYVYNAAAPFTFYGVTAQLHGQENSNCK